MKNKILSIVSVIAFLMGMSASIARKISIRLLKGT